MWRNRISPTVCQCGEPWELPCKCPESMLERFTVKHRGQVFYFEDLNDWVFSEFGAYDNDIIQNILNTSGIIELGDSMYQSPFELGVDS